MKGTAFTPGKKQRGVVNRYYYRSQNDLSSLELPIWSVNPRTRYLQAQIRMPSGAGTRVGFQVKVVALYTEITGRSKMRLLRSGYNHYTQ